MATWIDRPMIPPMDRAPRRIVDYAPGAIAEPDPERARIAQTFLREADEYLRRAREQGVLQPRDAEALLIAAAAFSQCGADRSFTATSLNLFMATAFARPAPSETHPVNQVTHGLLSILRGAREDVSAFSPEGLAAIRVLSAAYRLPENPESPSPIEDLAP